MRGEKTPPQPAAPYDEWKERYGFATIAESDLPDPPRQDLERIIFDRNGNQYQGREIDSFYQPRIDNRGWNAISAEEQGNCVNNIRILDQLNGHRGSILRELLDHGTHPAGLHLKQILA
jgi:hypothetical protein